MSIPQGPDHNWTCAVAWKEGRACKHGDKQGGPSRMTTSAILHCPRCSAQHIDHGKWARFNHKKHLCAACGQFFEVPEANIGVAQLGDTP